MRIFPSILEQTRQAIQDKLDLTPQEIKEVQIDICDGVFVPSKTYGSSGTLRSLKSIRRMTKGRDLELDLMIDLHKARRRKRFLSQIKAIHPERIILHYGVTDNWGSVFTCLAHRGRLGMEVGIGVHIKHNNQEVYDLLDTYPFSFIQVMGIEEVGYSGQPFSKKTYTKIKALRKRYPKIPISVDGGVKIKNTKKLLDAGATRVCPNSGLFKTENIQETYKTFKKI